MLNEHRPSVLSCSAFEITQFSYKDEEIKSNLKDYCCYAGFFLF